jgi:ABC-type iron transport system FetAB permease component
MLFLAVTSTLDKLKQVPTAFWWKVGAAVLAIIVIVFVLQKVAQMNKVVLTIIVLVVFTVVGVNWIYERNEPAFMTPIINRIAPFLPSKGSYDAKQQQTPGQQTPGQKK